MGEQEIRGDCVCLFKIESVIFWDVLCFLFEPILVGGYKTFYRNNEGIFSLPLVVQCYAECQVCATNPEWED